ncbi:nesprin-1 [Caerostris extrusa]|uniref:Nesprin-1 n=1 Tax=Caerostris extrusa TaxID=172846 RepID=A0AAV4PBR3_CAEEX|nr:nesprin-1 [Caerostris extrusa]
MPDSPDLSRKKLEIKLPKSPFGSHFTRSASPKFFDLKTRTPSPSPSGVKEFSESRVSSTSVSKTVVFSKGEHHVTQTESSHSEIETKSFCVSPPESRKLTYAQVARMSSPVGDGCRSVSPRPQSAGKSQYSKSHSNNVPPKPPDTKSSKSDSDQKSFLEVNSDNRNRPKLDDLGKGGDKEHFLSKTSEQDQKLD